MNFPGIFTVITAGGFTVLLGWIFMKCAEAVSEQRRRGDP